MALLEINIKKDLLREQGKACLNLSISLNENCLLSVTGPSGVGKTTLLKMLAGLIEPDDGQIRFNNEVWFDASKKISLTPQKRNIGFVFQDYALFPNLTVKENLEFALADKKHGKRVAEMLEVIELSNLSDKKPYMLSGGQQQRVALARALVRQPKLLLLDEPMSALDNVNRFKMQEQIIRIKDELDITIVLVSHDQVEVNKLSDVILEINNDGSVLFKEHMMPSVPADGVCEIRGEIVKKQNINDCIEITILSEGFVFTHSVSLQEDALYQLGQKVVVSFKLSDLKISALSSNPPITRAILR